MSFLSPKLSQRQARLVLSQLPHIGPILCKRLEFSFAGDLSAALSASKEELLNISGIGPTLAHTLAHWKEQISLDKIETQLEKLKVSFLIPEDPDFPPLLKAMSDTPIGLYIRGPLRPTERSIAIIGSRRATLYGLSVAKKLASEMSSLGFSIISGMARGIDAAAHEGALQANQHTAAILGSGVDIIYPPEHKALYHTLLEKGAVISEFPLSRPADRQTFPLRNRIIAGLCHATIVVESDLHGGSMITARLAGEYGRLIFAVPGRIDQVSSRGCHLLIREGATLLRSVDDLLEELAPIGQGLLPFNEETSSSQKTQASTNHELPRLPLSQEETCLLKILQESSACSIDKLIQLSTLSPAKVSASMLSLELKKQVIKRANGTFEAYSFH